MATSSPPPRGWYPDPGATQAWRWWDGARWGDQLHPYLPKNPPITNEAVTKERSAGTRLVNVGLACFVLSAALGILLRVADVSAVASMWHWIGQVYSQARQGQSASSLPQAPSRPMWSSDISTLIILPLEVVALVLVLTFQHRAAGVAKALGLRARLSPTFGVVSWFIPVANVVLPLIAWLDLLPTRHPRRAFLWLAWALIVASDLLTIGIYAVAGTSTMAVDVLSGLQLLGFAGAFLSARAVIEGVLTEHEQGAASAGVGSQGSARTL